MNREDMRQRLRAAREPWDVLVIGGGATGLGCALDAASRGLTVALVEQSDFAKGTSSRSTKLFHGGVRYLRGGQVGLVAQSLRERETVRRNAPRLVHDTEFLVPAYRRFERAYYGAGLALYDLLSRRGAAGSPRNRMVSRAGALALAPTLRAAGLRGGVVYRDLQFDDARFALELARAAADMGAVVMNYTRAEGFLEVNGRTHGAVVRDLERDEAFEVRSRVVVNAGGIFADDVRRMQRPDAPAMLRLSRGAHVVLERAFLPGDTAVLVPRTDDGRVVFLIPWRGRVLLGTTDTPVASPVLEPFATREDVDFLLDHAARCLARGPDASDVRSAFAGLRPLPARAGTATSRLRRDHRVEAADGVITIAGGKWTTYRLMAQEAVDFAVRAAGLGARPSRTRALAIADRTDEAGNGFEARVLAGAGELSADDRRAIERMAREEMACNVEDVLARRTRLLFLDARAAAACARGVAQVLGASLGRDEAWVDRQARDFAALAVRYLPA
jgi:glycerol-3-phosphate dehydrogenase